MARSRLSRAEQRELTRTRILDAAAALFAEKGFTGASLDEIAETAGYSKGAVYSNFAGKEDLFLSLMERRALEEQSMPGGSESDRSSDPIAGTGWTLATLDFFLTAVHKPELREALAEGYRETRSRLGPSLAGQREAGWATPEELATLVMALGSGLIIQAALDPEAVPESLYERALARLLGD
jgi:AcrR family transcriptional regulator